MGWTGFFLGIVFIGICSAIIAGILTLAHVPFWTAFVLIFLMGLLLSFLLERK